MLLSILFLLFVVHGIIRFYPIDQPKVSFDAFEMASELDDAQHEHKSHAPQGKLINHISWQHFDPNTISFDGLCSLGMDSMVAGRLVKYRSKGGAFKEAKDISKIYGIDQSWLQQALPYIKIEVHEEDEAIATTKKNPVLPTDSNSRLESNSQTKKLMLNTADSAALEALPWVGPYTAGEIIRLRKRLGGYRSYEQLLSIYKIQEQTIESLVERTLLDTNAVQKININSCGLKPLGMHPYLTWKQAKVILNYREQHGPFRSVKGILNTSVISDSVYSKIAPYLSVQ